MTGRLFDKGDIVTGTSIGEAVALTFARAGLRSKDYQTLT